MRQILIKEICKEKPNSAALGAFNESISNNGGAQSVESLRAERNSYAKEAESKSKIYNDKYKDIPIDSPMSQSEKALKKEIADLYSKANNINIKIRNIGKK